MKADPVQEFILESERNMRIAGAVAEGYVKAKEQIVGGFLDRLGDGLLKELKGWRCERWQTLLVDSEASFFLSKPTWDDYLAVSLGCFDYGQTVRIGVSRDESCAKRAQMGEILDVTKKVFPSARARRWWEAFTVMQSPAADWSRPENILRMHMDAKFLTEVTGQLVTLARVAAPVIDRICQAK